MQFDIWGPGASLPSIHPASLALLLIHPPGTISASSNPAKSPTTLLPSLQDGAIRLGQTSTLRPILNHLKRKGHDLDLNLNIKQRGESLAYATMIEEGLQDGWLWQMIVDEKNFTTITRPTMAKMLPLFDKWSGVSRWQEMAKQRCKLYTDEHEQGPMVPTIVTILRALQTKLLESSTEWFFSSPNMTNIDALALAYLSHLSLVDIPNPIWRRIMEEETPQLMEWVDSHKQLVLDSEQAITPLAETVQEAPKTKPFTFSGLLQDLGLMMPTKQEDEMTMTISKWTQVAGVLAIFGIFIKRNGILEPLLEAIK